MGRMSIEEQVNGLIDLVMEGQDAEELIHRVYEEIQEGSGNGPYPIGSKIKINNSWSGQGVDGGNVSVSRGDVVSVVMSNLGETGQDRMVLLADGKTRVVLPFAILGEGLEEQDDMKHGPKGHEVMRATGKLGGVVQGKAQGDEATPEDKELKPIPGSKKPIGSMPSMYQGKGKPSQSPVAQVTGQLAPSSIAGKTVEDITDAVLSSLEELSKKSPKAESLSEMLVAEDDEIMFAIIHEGLFGEGSYTVDDLEEIANMMKDKKKKNKKSCDDENGDEEDEEGYTEEDIDEILSSMHEKDKKKSLTSREAFQMDKKGDFYIEKDKGNWGVFGSESGFCYSLNSSKPQAEKELEKLKAKK